MANTAEHKAAERSLSDYLGIVCPLPHVAQKSLEWHLKQSAEAKEKLIVEAINCLYLNDRCSFEHALKTALKGFNVTTRG